MRWRRQTICAIRGFVEGSLPVVAERFGCGGRHRRRVLSPDRPLRWRGEGASLVGYSDVDYSMVSIAIVGMWLAALAILPSRSPRLLGNGVEESRRVLTATLSVFGVLAVFSMLFRLDIARGYLAIALPLGALALIVTRMWPVGMSRVHDVTGGSSTRYSRSAVHIRSAVWRHPLPVVPPTA